ncbi:MAG: HEAT repeat domain-containing protein [Nitrospirota bacterium]|nr:MAG: HEAT repeat domain-containing protein [Nitrospirota bacterium]
MQVFTVIICFLLVSLTTDQAFSRQRALTPAEKTHLKNAQNISLETVALTEKGLVDPQEIQHVVTNRFQEIGYTIIKDEEISHDVVVKVKCEERKTRTGPSTYGGDADSLHSPLPGWTGPACQITYGLNGEQFDWRIEVRTDFKDAMEAAKKKEKKNSGEYALTELSIKLKHDDFPLLLTAEWEQADRLINLMQRTEIDQSLKLKIIPLLGSNSDPSVLPTLTQALNDPVLAPQAAIALGQQGEQAEATLVGLLQTAETPELKIAAVKGLGEIATHSAQTRVYTPLVHSLQKPDTEIPVKTEIVRALGKLGDQEAVPVLEKLNHEAWTDPSSSQEMQELREALTWSLWQLNPDAHTG